MEYNGKGKRGKQEGTVNVSAGETRVIFEDIGKGLGGFDSALRII